MKTKITLKKHWALIGFILTFLLDNQLGLIELITANEFWQNFIKGIGAISLAYFWNTGKTVNPTVKPPPPPPKTVNPTVKPPRP